MNLQVVVPPQLKHSSQKELGLSVCFFNSDLPSVVNSVPSV